MAEEKKIAFLKAVKKGEEGLVKEKLAADEGLLSSKDKAGNNALLWSIANRRYDLASYLVEAGLDPSEGNDAYDAKKQKKRYEPYNGLKLALHRAESDGSARELFKALCKGVLEKAKAPYAAEGVDAAEAEILSAIESYYTILEAKITEKRWEKQRFRVSLKELYKELKIYELSVKALRSYQAQGQDIEELETFIRDMNTDFFCKICLSHTTFFPLLHVV